MAQELLLYHKPSCPFCRKVLAFLEEAGREVPMKDVSSDPAAREELLEIAGKTQVPCLLIDGKPLHESDDIIQLLEGVPESS